MDGKNCVILEYDVIVACISNEELSIIYDVRVMFYYSIYLIIFVYYIHLYYFVNSIVINMIIFMLI
jgi:hypothetical protein